MKLEKGMIARTNKGLLIDIIHDFDSELCAYKRDNISKASFNLIDLIEVGDYVNGRQVYFIKDDELYEECIHGMYQIKDIKSILTHEQYEANVYKLGGNNE